MPCGDKGNRRGQDGHSHRQVTFPVGACDGRGTVTTFN
jgi:hypothetical protein